MQMQLFLCIGTLYHIIKFTGARENDDFYDAMVYDDNAVLDQVSPKPRSIIKKENKEYEIEKKLGDIADLFGTNQHHSYPDTYKDLGRRFVFQYPYKEISNSKEDDDDEIFFDNIAKESQNENKDENQLIPIKAPPELVLAVAAKAALLQAANPSKPWVENNNYKEILRSGSYWNDVWQEDVNPNILRTPEETVIEPVKVKIMPSSKLYKLVTELKKISPRLIYVIKKE